MIFWKWWSILILAVFLFLLGEYFVTITEYLWHKDTTKLSVLILIITGLSTMGLGYYAYQMQYYQSEYLGGYVLTDKQLQMHWFLSDAVLSIGMIGTLVGFLIVLTTTFTHMDNVSHEAMKKVIADLASGMGIALITSLTGLICSIFLKLQLVLLDSSDEKL